MRIRLVATILLAATGFASGASPSMFELRAVADTPTDETKEYPMSQRGGGSEKVLLHSQVLLDRTALKRAAFERDAQGAPAILITLTETGGKRFGEITTKLIGKRLGILLDGKLHSAPTVRDAILGGNFTISGNFTAAEAAELVKKLNQSVVK